MMLLENFTVSFATGVGLVEPAIERRIAGGVAQIHKKIFDPGGQIVCERGFYARARGPAESGLTSIDESS
jgi:hypothetical protein